MTPHPARAVPATVQEGLTEDGSPWVALQQGEQHVILIASKDAPGSLVDAAVRLIRGEDKGSDYTVGYHDGHEAAKRELVEKRDALEQLMRKEAESMSPVPPELMLADAKKARRYPLCDACGQVIIRGET